MLFTMTVFDCFTPPSSVLKTESQLHVRLLLEWASIPCRHNGD